jgi:hypothetical protein
VEKFGRGAAFVKATLSGGTVYKQPELRSLEVAFMDLSFNPVNQVLELTKVQASLFVARPQALLDA